eukprot:gene22956-biopygen8337
MSRGSSWNFNNANADPALRFQLDSCGISSDSSPIPVPNTLLVTWVHQKMDPVMVESMYGENSLFPQKENATESKIGVGAKWVKSCQNRMKLDDDEQALCAY